MITHHDLLSMLQYDPETGNFTWLRPPSNKPHWIGAIAGSKVRGRIRIMIYRKSYFAHRLAWFYVHGAWPSSLIDHIDGNPLNNRLSNLREATPTQNQANKRRCKRNRSGFKGVGKCPRVGGKWVARIRIDGRQRTIGRFNTPDSAYAAYLSAAREVHGDFARG